MLEPPWDGRMKLVKNNTDVVDRLPIAVYHASDKKFPCKYSNLT